MDFRYGDYYEGNFHENLKSGEGLVFYHSGAKFNGIW